MENLRQEVERLNAEIAELRAALKGAQQQIAELLARLGQDSGNSNWPSSRDKNRKKRRPRSLRAKSKRKPGGQPGHEGRTLEFREHPDEVIVHRPETCTRCQQPFAADQAALSVVKRQVYDLPPLHPIIYEHQAVELSCRHCGQIGRGAFPTDVTQTVQYGPRVRQLAVYLKIEHFIPYERSRRFFADLYNLQLSPGTLQNIITRAAERLTPVVEKIKTALTKAEVLHVDESGFYIGGQRHWLHSAGTGTLTYYFPHPKRGHQATEAQGILPHFQGVAVHDGWSTYRRYSGCRHSLCNAHHLRELQAVVEHDRQPWARRFQQLLRAAKNVVDHARLAGEPQLSAAKIAQIERIYERLINRALQANAPPPTGWPKGKRGRVKKTKPRNLAERLAKYRRDVLAFVYDFKVPFDNNLAERDIRMLKVQQKVSGCFRSQAGANAFCIIRSYSSTMRKQGLNVWAALGSIFSANITLPDTTPV